ncbi:MAG: hypothetical protein KAT69_03175 [Candidatus Aminicenantes bacterium]|nr:hypothetical protein [Candidatus Aminicenantes bacterium]
MRKYMLYSMTGIIDSWKIIREDVKARTVKEARSKLRRRYPKIQSVSLSALTKI